jgi:hypothetical protein
LNRDNGSLQDRESSHFHRAELVALAHKRNKVLGRLAMMAMTFFDVIQKIPKYRDTEIPENAEQLDVAFESLVYKEQ